VVNIRVNNRIQRIQPEINHTREGNILRLGAHLRKEPRKNRTDATRYE
jgi:hypothetical protein